MQSLALLLVTAVWGATFPVLKLMTAQLSGVELSALRFSMAAACMLPWTLRARRSTWRDGALLGLLVLASYVAQAWGLEQISSNRSAFLTSLNVLMVPFLTLLLGRLPGSRVVFAALLACAGIALMSWDGGAHFWADLATIAGAAAYAVYILMLSRCAARHPPRALAATQLVVMALAGLLWMLLDAVGTQRLQTLPQRLQAPVLWGLLYLGVVASAGMLILQAWAQRRLSAQRAAVIYTMEPVFAMLFAWGWLQETLSTRALLGAGVVLMALLMSELDGWPGAFKRWFDRPWK